MTVASGGPPNLLARLLVRPVRVGRRDLPPIGLILLAVLGGILLLVVAVNRWATPSDEHAYWLAAQRLATGHPLYDPSADPATPYAYWYPPPLAQLLVPLTGLIPDMAFTVAWTMVLLGCLWQMADRRPLVALALVAWVPVAVELWFRNVHLLLALLVVVALRRTPLAWVLAAMIKVTPVIGLAFLVAARRYREAVIAGVAGLVVLAVSIAISPGAWSQFLDVVALRGGSSGASLVPVPFVVRLAVALALAVIGGRLGDRRGEALLVVGLTIGNPTLFFTALSLLIAIVPLWRRRPEASPEASTA